MPYFLFFREREEDRQTINVGILLNLFQLRDLLGDGPDSSFEPSKFHDTLHLTSDKLYCNIKCGCSNLMVLSALDSGLSSVGLSPGHCVMVLGNTIYSHSTVPLLSRQVLNQQIVSFELFHVTSSCPT